ncbi:MAG: TonB-dependent receptor [Cyclobacteriaceae bacterium]
MKKLLTVLLFFLVSFSYSQSIKGTVRDLDGEALFSATAMLLKAEDSVLASFAMSDAAGRFEIKKVPNGNYILRVNFVGLKPMDKPLKMTGSEIDLGTIELEPDVLEEVVVEGEAIPITMKKDTIEYNAAAFGTKPNAVVEDLLRKLPGVEVERDGTIKAQGETVNKVLVDGKEFFGNDPKMATKNLPADAVNKVQMFDQKSEFSQFSGVDDGNESKTINLTLKEDHKKGTFGTLSGGYGTDDRYTLSANVNQFREDNQFSFIGKHNNINEQGFSLSDYISFMGGLGNMGGGSGRVTIGGGGGLPIANGLSDGFITTSSAGLNFNRDFNEKTEVRASYIYSRIENITNKTTDRTNFVNDETFETSETSNTSSVGNNHNLNLNVKHKIDKTQDIQVRNTVGFQKGDVLNITNTSNFSDANTSNSLSDYRSDGNGMNLNSSLMYRKKFNKVGRTLVAELSYSNQSNDSEYALNTNINSGQSLTNQEQLTDNNSHTIGTEIAYTEPVGRSKYLEFRYVHNVTNGDNDKDFYDVSGSTRTFNSALSSLYERRYDYNRAGVSFNYAKEDFRITTGTNYQFSTLDGDLPEQSASFSNEFNRTLPFARINYDFNNSVGLSLNYNTRLNVPSINQLQPVTDNSNPLNIYQGNPELDAEYIHSARLNFRFFDQFSSTSLFSFINVSYTLDNIVTSRTVDSQTFGQTSIPVNADNSLTITNYTSFSRPVKFAKSRFRVSNRITMNEGFTIINDVTSETKNTNNTFSLSFENLKKKVIDWSIGSNFTNGKTSGSQESSNQDFTNQTYFVETTLFFLKKWSVSSIFDYQVYESASFADDQEIKLWEASIQKNFLKNDRGEIKLSVFDILNQNQGINRTTNFNYIEEERIASIGTYYMVSMTYRLSAFNQNSGFQFRSIGNRRR